MSYGFIKTMKENPNQSYVEVSPIFLQHILAHTSRCRLTTLQVLQNTRQLLAQKYQQIPQLSVGGEYDLRQRVSVCIRQFYFTRTVN